jgi:uroporphyrinogen decarboxylase
LDEREEEARMNPRDRLLTTLAHKEPDRVPLTGKFWLDTRLKLRKHYGVKTDEDLFEKMSIDRGAIAVQPLTPRGWKPTSEYAKFCDAIGYEVHSQHAIYEEWGIKRKLGSKGKSVLRQFYFTSHPWKDFRKPSQIEKLELPNIDEPGRFDMAIQTIKEEKDIRVIWGSLGHVLWTRGWELRGMLRFMKDLHTDSRMTETILDKLVDYNCYVANRLLDLGCDGISVTEDWGNNYSMFISPDLWRKYFKLRYKKLFDTAKRRGKLVFFHSDGNITPIVDDLVEIGIDVLNPVQPECMNQFKIKQRYGDKITIDTGVSNQRTLPFGTPDDVRHEALNALRYLAPDGGFVYGTSHYALYDVPIENIITLYETLKKYASYPIRIPD